MLRTCVDRLAADGHQTIAAEMKKVRSAGKHHLLVRGKQGEPSEAVLEIKYARLQVLPPIGKQAQYPALTLTVIRATERGTRPIGKGLSGN